MSTVAEIEHAIETLPTDEYAKLLAWIDKRRAGQVDAEFEVAVLSGKFDGLAERASREIEAGGIVPLEEFLRGERWRGAPTAMKSTLTRDFRALLERLPPGVQVRAYKQFVLWTRDHSHPSLHFKRVGRFWSARVHRDYRVLGLEREGTIHWFYIGPHDGYEARI